MTAWLFGFVIFIGCLPTQCSTVSDLVSDHKKRWRALKPVRNLKNQHGCGIYDQKVGICYDNFMVKSWRNLNASSPSLRSWTFGLL